MVELSAQGIYRRLETLREPFLRRARDAVELTIPTLLREDNSYNSSTRSFKTPWQGVGARGVNNLSSKLLLTLMPPNSPFFRLRVDEGKAGILLSNDKVKTEIEQTLAAVERQVMFEVETTPTRVKVHEALKHLVCTGNALIHFPSEGAMRVFHLDSYVCERDASGNLLLLITRELVSPMMLPEDFVKTLSLEGSGETYEARSEVKNLELFTCVRRYEGKWNVHQEVSDKRLPGTDGSYTEQDFPWLPLRMHVVDGEDYGRGYVEEYQGDLRSLEGLTQAIVEGAAAAARIVVMVRPNSTTRIKNVANAPNGAVIPGHKDDVTMLQAEKQADLSVASQVSDKIEQRLAFAFLLNSSVQRQAERVTAEEIRYMAQELEDALGGVYSVLTQELQLPLVRLLMSRLQKAGKLPKFNNDTVKPTIVTGLEALGRGHDLQRLQVAFDVVARTYGPEALARFTNPLDGIARILTSSGVDPAGLMKTPEEIQQEMQQAQMMETVNNLGGDVMKMAGQAVTAQAA
jgi:hypothetical protein